MPFAFAFPAAAVHKQANTFVPHLMVSTCKITRGGYRYGIPLAATISAAVTTSATAAIIPIGDTEVLVVFSGGAFVVLIVGEVLWATAMARHV
nr:hypothetical protein HmN_000227800 [Hymenolepis microstoma]